MDRLTLNLIRFALVPPAFAGLCLLIGLVLTPIILGVGAASTTDVGAHIRVLKHEYGFDRETGRRMLP